MVIKKERSKKAAPETSSRKNSVNKIKNTEKIRDSKNIKKEKILINKKNESTIKNLNDTKVSQKEVKLQKLTKIQTKKEKATGIKKKENKESLNLVAETMKEDLTKKLKKQKVPSSIEKEVPSKVEKKSLSKRTKEQNNVKNVNKVLPLSKTKIQNISNNADEIVPKVEIKKTGPKIISIVDTKKNISIEEIKCDKKNLKRTIADRKKSEQEFADETKNKKENSAEKTKKIRDEVGNLSLKHIMECLNAVFHLNEEELKKKNGLFAEEDAPLLMQITCIKVPKAPKRQMRIPLPHSLLLPNDEVALIVCDSKKATKKDYTPSIEFYDELLKKNNITEIKHIIPMMQVKTEYSQFELKRKFAAMYDYFLIDGRIAGHMSHLLGNAFTKKRKLPISIRMDSKDLKHEIQHALKKTTLKMSSKADCYAVQIGNFGMDKKLIAENIISACKYLSKNFPGRWRNIRSVHLKTRTSLAIPIYMSLKIKNKVKVPSVKPKRPKAYKVVSGELSTIPNAKVTVTPEGDVTLEKPKVVKKKLSQKSKKIKNTKNIVTSVKIETAKK